MTSAITMYMHLFQVDNAVKAYVKNNQYEKAASLYQQTNETEKAIKILLLDKQGKLLPNVLQLALEYTNTEPDVPLEIGCSVNEVAQRTAHYYLQKGKIGKAIDCVDHFSEVKDKVSFFKTASSKAPELIDEAINVLFKAEQYNDVYHLLKGKGKFERGAEIAEKLQNDQVCCEFLLLSVKKKLLTVDECTTEDKVKEANSLKEACRKLHHNDITLTLQVELICGILNEEPQACSDVGKKFINNINHFGAIEALNAAFCLKEPNLDVHEISVIVNCLQIACIIINEIKSTTKLSLRYLQHCRKFYLFEQSENRFFLPPLQFYWIPTLKNKHLPKPDSDGMVQFDALTTYKVLEQHVTGIAHKWLQLDLEKVLFNIITSEEYGSLSSILEKSLDIQKFVKKCYEMSDYLLCCIKLIEISHCHFGKPCDVGGKIDKWEKLIKYASLKILDIFSPQWMYFFKISKRDVELIKKSKITCDCLRKMLRSDDEFTININTFLHHWRILKLTGSDLSTLINSLKNEEVILADKFENKDQTKPSISGSEKSEASPATEVSKEQKPNDKNKGNFTETAETSNSASKDIKEKSAEDGKQEFRNEKVKSEVSSTTEKHKDTSKKQDEVPGIFIKTESGYSHSFFAWLNSCAQLENGNFMRFAEGVIKRLFILIAKRKLFNPKITVMNITSVLEVLCIGLFASLKAAARYAYKTNLLILFPKFYEHLVTSYDPINFTSRAFLDLVTTSVAKSEDLRQLYDRCLHLLHRILQLLLGNIEFSSFKVLDHAALKNVSNHGFERCLVLCLSLFGNLWPLMHGMQQANVLYLYETMNEILRSRSRAIKDNSADLFAIIQGIGKVKSTKNIFDILLDIQLSNQSYMVSLQYQIQKQQFSFNKIESYQFPTQVFRFLQHDASNSQKSSQGKQLQYRKNSNISIPKTHKQIPKTHQQLPANPVKKPISYLEAVKQSMSKVPYSSTQISENVSSKPHQDHEISRNVQVTNTELSAGSSQAGYNINESSTIPTVHTPLITEYSVPMHSTLRVTSNIPTLDNPQHNLDESVILKNDEETTLSHGSAEQFEDQTQVFHDENTNAELQPSFTTAAFSDLPVSHSGIDVDKTTASFNPTAAESHQLQHAYAESQSKNTVPFQSSLKPNAESFVPAAASISVPSASGVDPRQVQEPTLQTVHSPSNNYQSASMFNQQAFFPAAAYGINTIPQPLPVPYINPVMGQYMPTYGYGMPDPLLYGQPMLLPYQTLYPSVPWPYMDNMPTSPQEDIELEDLNYYSSSSTKNVEASGNENVSDLPNDCYACGHMHAFEDEKSKVEHYASPEHLKNTELYSAYQTTIKKYAKDIDDTRKIIENANTYTGTGHAAHDKLIHAQIVKIKEWKNKFDREQGQIEDKFDWSTGQRVIEHHVNELNLLKEHYEKLKTFKRFPQ